MRSFSLSNMEEPALKKSHAHGKKHQNAVKTSGKNTSVWGFLKKDDQKASTSTQKEEPLACKRVRNYQRQQQGVLKKGGQVQLLS